MRIVHFLFAMCISTIALCQTELFINVDMTENDLVGEQVTIFNMLINQGVYGEYQFVQTDYSALQDDNGIITIGNENSIIQTTFLFKTSQMEYTDVNSFEWVGSYYAYDTAVVHYAVVYLVRHEGRLIGNINLDTLAYEIYDLTGGIQIILEKNLEESEDGFCSVEDENSGPTLNKTDPCDVNSLRILFIATTSAPEPDPEGKGRLVVLQLNDIYFRSGVYQNTAKFAAAEVLSLSQSGDRRKDLEDWYDLPSVDNLRYLHKADIVVFLTAKTYGAYNGEALQIEADFDHAFCLVTSTTAADSRYVGSHEITHLMGGRHNTDPTISVHKGYDFRTGVNFKHRITIMSVEKKEKPRIAHVSNPNVYFFNKATGDATHKVAEIVDSRYYYMESLYPEPPLNIYAKINRVNPIVHCEQGRTLSVSAHCGKEPYTYQWQKSLNGITWSNFSSGNTSSITFQMPTPYPLSSPFSSLLVRCIVTDDFSYSYIAQTVEYYFCDPFMHKTERSVNTMHNSVFEVYPNPTVEEITLKLNLKTIDLHSSIKIHSASGKLLFEGLAKEYNNGNNEFKLNLKRLNLAKGLYYVEFKSLDKSWYKTIIYN